MSVKIKGMTLPTNCAHCPCLKVSSGEQNIKEEIEEI